MKQTNLKEKTIQFLNLMKAYFLRFSAFIKTHLYYLLSKRNIIVISVINLIYVIFLLIESQAFKGHNYIDTYREECLEIYIESVYPFIKIIFLFFILFVNLSYFTGNESRYSQYLIKDKESKILFYISKYISIIIFVSIEFLFLYLSYEIVKMIMPYSKYPFRDLSRYFGVYLMGLYYLLLSSIILIITRSNFALVIPIITFFVSDILVDELERDEITKYIFIFTVSSNIENGLYFGYIHALLLIILLGIVNVIVVKEIDIL